MASTVQPNEAIQSFVKLLGSLQSSESFGYVRKIVEENAKLRETNRDLHVTNRVNLETLAKVENELKSEIGLVKKSRAALEELGNKNKTLQSTIEDSEKERLSQKKALDSTAEQITILQKGLKDRDAEMNKARERAVAEEKRATQAEEKADQAISELLSIQEKNKEQGATLDYIESFKLQPPKISSQNIGKCMNSLYEGLHHLASTYCAFDLDEDTLSNAGPWEQLRLCKPVNRMPIPVSNSSTAKNMRLAAIIVIVSSILCDQIFRPDYLLKTSNEFSDILNDLLDEDSRREQHLRAELVALQPERQKANGAARLESAVVDIFNSCAVLIPRSKQLEFRTDVGKLCDSAYSHWWRLQRLRQRVESSFTPRADEQWKLLTPLDDKSQSKKGKTRAEQVSVSQNNGSEVRYVVWPCFLLVDEEIYDLVSEGVGICQAQIDAAMREEHAAPSPGFHRVSRLDSRKRRSSSAAMNGEGGQPTTEKSFLAEAPGKSKRG